MDRKETRGNSNPMLSDESKQPLKDSEFFKNFEDLKQSVLIKKPVLADILSKHGEKTMVQYANDYFDVNQGEGLDKRQDEFLETFGSRVKNLLGPQVAASAVQQLKKYYFVSTADHHGPLCDPYFLSSNLVIGLAGLERNDPDFQNVIVLSCANVSLNNGSFPRGLLFSATGKEKTKTHRLSFLPSNSHSSTVYNFRPHTQDEVKKVKKVVEQKFKEGEIQEKDKHKLLSLITEVYENPEVLACENFSEQITKTNFVLWRKYFEDALDNSPNLIYLEQETLVVELLVKNHLGKDTIINKILFDPKVEQALIKHFNNVYGAFSLEQKWGTYLFWGVSKDKNYRIALWKKDGYLMSEDGDCKIECTPEGILNALQRKDILPSMQLIFFMLSFFYGLKCMGGFSQVNYLTFMKEAYLNMMKDLGEEKEVALCEAVQTKEMCEFVIAHLSSPTGESSLVHGLDFILHKDKNSFEVLRKELKDISLVEAVNPMLPGFYRVIYPNPVREERLMNITAEDIIKYTGLDKKIQPCIYMK